MRVLRLENPRGVTRALWVANAAGLLLLAAAGVRLGELLWRGNADRLPAIIPFTLSPLPLPAVPSVADGNPFDPGRLAWRLPEDQDLAGGAGEVKGVILLPGIRRAVTDKGSAKPGETIGAGRLLAVEGGSVVIDDGGGPKKIETPGARRPRLEDLNRAAPAAARRP
jgi:hypothetical protein